MPRSKVQHKNTDFGIFTLLQYYYSDFGTYYSDHSEFFYTKGRPVTKADLLVVFFKYYLNL